MTRDRVALPGRRRLLQGVGALSLSLAGGSLLAGCANQVAPFFAGSTSNRPETKTVRLQHGFATCLSPIFLAGDILRADGFDVDHVPSALDVVPLVSAGDLDFAMQAAANTTVGADTDNRFVHLAGIHVGCFELFAQTGIRSMSDLKGKRVAVNELGAGAHLHLAMMASYVGLDPNRDFILETGDSTVAMQAFEAGRIDGFMGFPPEPQLLRQRNVGHVLVNTHLDRPWSQSFCCILIGNREFVQNNPVATKQVVRAVLTATDLCANEPSRAADLLLARGDITDRDATFQMLSRDVSYDRWREYDPEATIRFYALLLHQIGMVKTTPDKLIAQSTDWRILNELKRELKA